MWTFLSLLHPLWPMLTQYLNHILLIWWDYTNHTLAIYMFKLLPISQKYFIHIPPSS